MLVSLSFLSIWGLLFWANVDCNRCQPISADEVGSIESFANYICVGDSVGGPSVFPSNGHLHFLNEVWYKSHSNSTIFVLAPIAMGSFCGLPLIWLAKSFPHIPQAKAMLERAGKVQLGIWIWVKRRLSIGRTAMIRLERIAELNSS